MKLTLVIALATLAMTGRALAGQADSGSAPSPVTPPPVSKGTAKLVEHYNPNQMLRLAIALKPPHFDEEQQLIKELHDKKSPQFHKFLTADEFNERFAPSVEDEQAVVDWAQSQGLTITARYPNRLVVDLEAPAGTIEKALNVKINNYQLGSTSFFSNDREPQVPSHLADVIWSIQGLNTLEHVRPVTRNLKQPKPPDYTPGPAVSAAQPQHVDAVHSKVTGATKGSQQSRSLPDITNGNYDPTDIYSSESYDYGFSAPGWGVPLGGLYNQGHCCNPLGGSSAPPDASVAIAAFGADLTYSDVTTSFAGPTGQYPYLAGNIDKVYVDGTYTCGSYDDGCLEVTMDTEWSLAMSNSFGSWHDTAEIWIYEGVNYYNQTVLDVYNRMLSDGNARVFSTSWACAEGDTYGEGDCYWATMQARDSVLSAMVLQGWTLVAASGDEGATADWCNPWDGVMFPASDPNVIAAGGTLLTLDSGPFYVSETGWTGGTWSGACASNDGGSTGGFSGYWGTPSFQSSLGFGSRAVPDIALNAAAFQNVYIASWGGLIGVGGTSIVAPELAGFFAQENAYLLSLGNVCGGGSSPCAPMGDADYYIYDEAVDQSAPHYPFYDITSGCNSNDITAAYLVPYYCAGSGYDEVTGWGSANMLQLAWAINWFSTIYTGPPSVTFSGPAVNQWYNTEETVSWTVADNSSTGIAGFTQGWDSIPTDPYSEPTPGTGNSFYSGPQFPNATSGWLDFVDYAVSQGCHTAYVDAWDNMGELRGVSYGPVCYDTIAPVTTATLSGTLSGSVYVSSVNVTLTATDSGSGVASTSYQIDGGSWLTYTATFAVSALGTHTVNFYSKDKAGNVESTKSVSFTIDSSTTTSVASSLNPSTYGQSVTFTATVTSTGGTPTGTVTFKDGSTTLGTGTLSSGKATFAISTLSVASHSITAVYGGAGSFLGSTSAALTQTVNAATSSTAVASSLNPSTYGQSVTFTATVTSSGGTPTGTVTFKDGSTTLGTGTLSSGKATFAISTLSVASHSITAVYGGAGSFLGSTSAALTQTVKATTSSTSVASSLNPSNYGAAVIFTATVTSSGGVPQGTVTYKDGSTTLGTGTLGPGGKSTFTIATLAVGGHSITAVYAGNVDFSGSTSSVLTQTVNKPTSSTTVTSSSNPSTWNHSVTFTAAVTSSGGVPQGTVTYKDGSTTLGTGTLGPGGKSTFTIATLAVGSHSITAVYAGNVDFGGSTSPVLTQTVNKATSTTTVTSSLNPSKSAQSVTFTATVTSGAGTPTGTVTFKDGATTLGTGTLSSGKATFSTSSLTVGTHSITAVYGGATDFNTSTSAVLSQVVNL
ncbi:MAG TPA: Ig-like domain repeat protein [Terriglobia bacterium]